MILRHTVCRVLASMTCAALLLIGCSREPAPEAVRTVSWYQQHAKERKAMVARCADDPGTLGKTPNCLNATQAESIEGIGSLRDLPPMGLTPQKHSDADDPDRSQARP